jgi:hypothetical protein
MKYLAVLPLLCVSVATAQEKKIEQAVRIEFPKDGYSFTLAEAAKGINIPYTIRVTEELPNVIALQTGPSYHEPPGPSGLHPHESIKGQGQLYSLDDFGLAFQSRVVATTIKKGEHKHFFEWDGRNWRGPSDTNTPKGKAFPAGTYEVEVVVHGNVKTEKGAVPYRISGKAKLVLK